MAWPTRQFGWPSGVIANHERLSPYLSCESVHAPPRGGTVAAHYTPLRCRERERHPAGANSNSLIDREFAVVSARIMAAIRKWRSQLAHGWNRPQSLLRGHRTSLPRDS